MPPPACAFSTTSTLTTAGPYRSTSCEKSGRARTTASPGAGAAGCAAAAASTPPSAATSAGAGEATAWPDCAENPREHAASTSTRAQAATGRQGERWQEDREDSQVVFIAVLPSLPARPAAQPLIIPHPQPVCQRQPGKAHHQPVSNMRIR